MDKNVIVARKIISRAEKDLGHLTDGQRRDLLMDNLPWDSVLIASVVDKIRSGV